MRTTQLDITIDQRHGALPVAVELTVTFRCEEGDCWEPVAVTWADVTVWPADDQGQLFRANDWSHAMGRDWLRWLKELDPPTVVVDYGQRNQRTVKLQDACEEQWAVDNEAVTA